MNDPSVAIIATGGANIASLQFALERLKVESVLTADAQRIRAASHVILPGVGAAGNAMGRLRAGGLVEIITTLEQPVLGICLGMQLMFESSDEDATRCLGIMPGKATRFVAAPDLPVPHMGWNTVDVHDGGPLLEGIDADNCHAYFVHSYAIATSEFTRARCTYGSAFSACVQRGNFFGVQFHPERSAGLGARLLQNFMAIR